MMVEGEIPPWNTMYNVKVFGKVRSNCPYCGNTHKLCRWVSEYCRCHGRTTFEYATPPSFWTRIKWENEQMRIRWMGDLIRAMFDDELFDLMMSDWWKVLYTPYGVLYNGDRSR